MEHRLDDIVAQLGHPTILVLGDLILDRYVWGHAEKVSPEAPVLVLRADEEEVRLGGAASVASLLRALEANVVLAGVIGDDPPAQTMRALLTETGIDHSAVFSEPGRLSTTKDRYMGRAANRHPSQVLRVDRETRTSIRSIDEERLIKAVLDRLDSVQVILVSDYAKGVCTLNVLKAVIEAGQERQIPVFVDPARIADYSRYRGAALLVPNRPEASMATGMTVATQADALAAAKKLSEQHAIPEVLVKLDCDGMVLARSNCVPEVFPAKPRKVYDVTGAGDMVLAVVGLCRACWLSWAETVPIANAAAGLEVERHGVTPITREEICGELVARGPKRHDKVVSRTQLLQIVEEYRDNQKKIVFTNGCFDLLHVGHVTYLHEAARLGDVLIVAINSDESVRRIKGTSRPIINQHDRAVMLAALESVSHVLVFEEETPHDLLHRIRPDVLVKGGTYSVEDVVGKEVVTRYGGQVRVTGKIGVVSTTAIISGLRQNVLS